MLFVLLLLQTGKFIPEKSNIWRDCCDGMYDWVKEHILEVRQQINSTVDLVSPQRHNSLQHLPCICRPCPCLHEWVLEDAAP